jgi:hypothetical protein
MRMSFLRSTWMVCGITLAIFPSASLAQPPMEPPPAARPLTDTDWNAALDDVPAVSCQQQTGCACQDGGGFFGGGEYLLIRTHFSEAVAFATVNDALTAGGLQRSVQASELDFDYDSSFRAFVGYDFGSGSEIQFTYWNFDTSTAVAGLPGPGQTIVDPFGNLALPGMGINTSASVRLNVFDLDFRKNLAFCHNRLGLTLATGLRVADVDQYYDSIINAGGVTVSRGDFNVQFTGIGPHFDAQTSTWFGSANQFSLFGSLGTAILIGDYEIGTNVVVPGFAVGGQFADRTRAVPVLESRLGASWRLNPAITLSAGWMFQAWFNIGTSGGTFDGERLPVAPVDTAFGGADDADIMSFDGLFLRAEAQF